jgi:hypothetical protein
VSLTPGDADSFTVRTDPEGEFNTSTVIPASAVRGGIPFIARDLQVEGAFNGSGENVESATTMTTISYTPPTAQSARNILLGTFAVAVALGGAVLWQRRGSEIFRSPQGATETIVTPEGMSEDFNTGLTAERLLERAESATEAGEHADAVRLGYAALRQAYVVEYGFSPALTHWELTRELQEFLPQSEQETLSKVTEAYERTAYATGADATSGEDVSSLLDEIKRIVTESK